MSAPQNVDTRARLLIYARWAAIGLACLAALIIAAFSGAAALRIAAFMAVIAVVLVVLSITLNGASSTKLHLEETLLDEIDMLREDVRADITTAARATHRALAEKVAHLHENVEHVRRQVDERALGEARVARPSVAAPPARRAIAGPGVPVVHTETVHVTTQTYVDPVDDPRAAGFVRPTTRRPERDDYVQPVRDMGRPDNPRADMGRADMGRADMGRGDSGRADIARGDGGRGDLNRLSIARDAARGEAAHGDMGRTDYGADRIRPREPHLPDESGRRGGDERQGWHDRSDSPSAGRVPAREPRDESWPEQRLRDLVAPHPADPYDDAAERDWRLARHDDAADDPQWSAMRAGDRWAEVRTDERGRELRMGERRATVRADETGTQMRIVDRWSSVRQENAQYDDGYEPSGQHGTGGQHESAGQHGWSDHDPDDSRGSAFRAGADNSGETRSERRRREAAEGGAGRVDDDRRTGRRPAPEVADGDRRTAPDRGRPALPASGPEPAAGWMRGRSDEPRSDRHADHADDRWGTARADSPRSARDISGELVRRPAAPEPTTRRAEHGWSDPQRPAAEPPPAWESRSPEQRPAEARPLDSRRAGSRVPDPRQTEPRQTDPRVPQPRQPEWRATDPRSAGPRAGETRPGDDRWGGRSDTGRGGRDSAGGAYEDPREARRESGRTAPEPRATRDDNRWEREPSGGRSAVRPRLEFDDNDDRWR